MHPTTTRQAGMLVQAPKREWHMRGRSGLAAAASAACPQRASIASRSWRGRWCSMTGRKPRLQVAALDLYCSLELHVPKVSAVAGGVDGGLWDLPQPRDFRDVQLAGTHTPPIPCT